MGLAEFLALQIVHVVCRALASGNKTFLHFPRRRKEDQHLRFFVADLCKSMWHHTRPEYAVTGFGVVKLVADLYQELSLKFVPPFILFIMQMKRRAALFLPGGLEHIDIPGGVFCRYLTIKSVAVE